ncbi:MAG: alpha/beta fold hydrolase [Thermoleophilaceae bacterium]
MPTAEINGQSINYDVQGEGDPLLCVMGLGADSLAWALQLPAFAQHFRTVVFDNRDVGQSSYSDGPYEIRDMAQDALALADHLELESFHLLGVSMGGAIAQEIALAAPGRVRTLTLAVTFAGGGAWARERSRLWGAQALTSSREDHLDLLMLQCFSEAFYENPEGVAFMRNMFLANPHPQAPEAFVRQLEASGRHETRDRIGSLEMPVHVIGAGHDTLVPPWKSQELAELIPDARLTVVADAPHGVNWERAEEFNATVLGFIREHAGAPA